MRILTVMAAGAIAVPEMKTFRIPRRHSYTGEFPDQFWAHFPVNLVCPGIPSLNKKKLKRWADMLGVTDKARLDRVLGYIQTGADKGCKGRAREASRSTNAASAFQYGAQVTDAIAEWVKKDTHSDR